MTLICSGCGYAGITFTKIMNNFVAFWLVAATFVFVIGVLCLAPARNNASWVFLEFTNETGYDNMAIVFFLGLLQAGWTTIGYEQGITISESTENAAKSGPRGLLICIAFGLAQGFLITFAALFTIQDLDALVGADLPIAEYFMQVTRNPSVSAFFMVMMIVAQAGSFANTAVSFTRLLHSMARNNCLPYSDFFRKLDRDVPVRLAILQIILMIVLILPVFGTMIYWKAILSTTIISYNCAYGMPLLTRLMFVRGKMPKGPFDLGRWSLPLNVAGLIWVLFLAVVLCFPSSIPTDGENFNYACVMLGAVILFALVTWHTSGKYKYKGPDNKEVGEGFVVDSDSDSSTEKR
ncbi:amino acid/polyamine transporter I [Gongronella butleri]|nr:amino acid/polyamine transporter I [Gongronella butleri]